MYLIKNVQALKRIKNISLVLVSFHSPWEGKRGLCWLEKGKCHSFLQKRPKSQTQELQDGQPHFSSWENHRMSLLGAHKVKQVIGSRGFTTSKLCLTNLIVFYDKTTRFMDTGTVVNIIFIDFSKILTLSSIILKLGWYSLHG